MKKNIILSIVFIVIVSLVVSSFIFIFKKQPLAESFAVKRQTAYKTVRATGVLLSESQIYLSANSSGIISELYYKASDVVKKGDILAQQDNQKLLLNVKSSENSLNNAINRLDALTNNDKKISDEKLLQAKINEKNTYEQYLAAKKAYEQKSSSTQIDETVNRLENDYKKALSDYEKAKALYEEKAISQNDLENAKRNMENQKSLLNSATANKSAFSDDLDFKNAQNKYEIAKSQLREAEKQNLSLSFGGSLYKDALSSVELAKLNLEKAKKDYEDTIILAPYDGIITECSIKKGEFVTAGTKLFTFQKNNDFYVKADIDQKLATNIMLKQRAIIYFEGVSEAVENARVSFISPTVSASDDTVEIHISFENYNKAQKANLTVNVEIVTNEVENSIVIDKKYLTYYNEVSVLKVVRGRVTIQNVEIKEDLGDKVIISKGISENDVLVLPDKYKKGDKVKN